MAMPVAVPQTNEEEIMMPLQIRQRLKCMTHISSMRKIEDPPPYWKVLVIRVLVPSLSILPFTP
jgi:hypothetical protein